MRKYTKHTKRTTSFSLSLAGCMRAFTNSEFHSSFFCVFIFHDHLSCCQKKKRIPKSASERKTNTLNTEAHNSWLRVNLISKHSAHSTEKNEIFIDITAIGIAWLDALSPCMRTSGWPLSLSLARALVPR